MHGVQQFKEHLEVARQELEVARRNSDLGRMSELQYGAIPDLEKQLSKRPTKAEDVETTLLLRSKVGEEEIAEVVSMWTGIPVSRMLAGEREKLLNMEQVLHQSSHWSSRSCGQRGQCSASLTFWFGRSKPPQWVFFIPRSNGCG